MPFCSALNCSNRLKKGCGKSFHRFPKSNQELLKKWLQNLKRHEEWMPAKRSVLCSDHFTKESFDRTGQTTRLYENAVPTLFNFTVKKKSNSQTKSWKMPTCAARECQNRAGLAYTGKDASKKTFHMFPKNPALRERWALVAGRKNWIPGARAVLCSDHFEDQCFDRTGQTTRLRVGALPTKGKFVRRKGRGAVKLEPFYSPLVKQEPHDPSYEPFTNPVPPKKRPPGRPRKRPLPESDPEEEVDDPIPVLPPSPPPPPPLPPAPKQQQQQQQQQQQSEAQEDQTHFDHFYCRNDSETQILLRQKEKKIEYLKMKLQYLEGASRLSADPPGWSEFRRAQLMEEAEEIRHQLRLSGKIPSIDGRRKVEKGETLTMKTGSVELIPKNSGQLEKKIQVLTGKSGEKLKIMMANSGDNIQLFSGNFGLNEDEEVKQKTKKAPNKTWTTTNEDTAAESIQLVDEELDIKPGHIALTRNMELNFDENGLIKTIDELSPQSELRKKEEEINALLKKIKTMQQRKRREKQRSKARIFRYVVMVEPKKKKRGRKKQVEESEEDEDNEDEDEDREDTQDSEQDEDEEGEDTKHPIDPIDSIHDSVLSHTASLMIKQQRTLELQQKEKEVRELRKSIREAQEREKEHLEQIEHLQDVVTYFKDNRNPLDNDNEESTQDSLSARDKESTSKRIEDFDKEVVGPAVIVHLSDRDQFFTSNKRHCVMCRCNLHRRSHKQPSLWSPSTLDSPPSPPQSFLPLIHKSIHKKSRLSLRPSEHPLCSDCKLILGRRKRRDTSVISSFKF